MRRALRSSAITILALMLCAFITAHWRLIADFATSGLPIGTYPQWPVVGVPAPTYVWTGDDPTGSLGYTTNAYTLTGSTESINTPYCPDGGWDDLTNGCMTARRFDGTNDWYVADSDFGDPLANSFTACGLVRGASTASSADQIVSKTTAAGAWPGWVLYSQNTGNDCAWYAQGAAGNTGILAVTSSRTAGNWNLCCGVINSGTGTKFAWNNGISSPTSATDIGSVDSSTNLYVGNRADTAQKWQGDIAWVGVWPTTALTTTELTTLYHTIAGIRDTKGAAATFTNTGPVYAWFDGLLEGFGDDFPFVGSEIAPGMTGAGVPVGYAASRMATNSILQSAALDTTWATVDGGGAAVVACGNASTPYRDGRTTCRLTDDQAGAIEYITQNIDVTAEATGAVNQICVLARDASGTVLDLQIVESGGCAGSTIDFAAKTIDTTWKQYAFTHTLADGDCTTLSVRVAPADFADVANTGTAQASVSLYKSAYLCPAIWVPTTTAAVTAGSSGLFYTTTGRGIVDASGNLRGQIMVQFSYVPLETAQNYFDPLSFEDTSLEANFNGMQCTGGGVCAWYTRTGGGGWSIIGTSGALAWTPGTTYNIVMNVNYDTDVYSVVRDGVTIISSSAGYVSPTGIARLTVGNDGNLVGRSNGAISNLKVRR